MLHFFDKYMIIKYIIKYNKLLNKLKFKSW